MKLIMLLSIMVLSVSSAFAESRNDYYDFLAKKVVEDFHKGIDLYNSKKEAGAPAIKRGFRQNYNIVYKKTRIRFTVLNYVNDEIFVNDKLVQRSTFGQKKTTWFNPLISDAIADDSDLDAETTKVMLTALGGLATNLEEVGMMCFMVCERDIKRNNRKKIIDMLNAQHEQCSQQLYAQEETIKKYPSYQMVSLLHSTFNPEFKSIRALIQKISESNVKKVREFMTNKMMITKNYTTCVEVMTSGTAADGAYNPMEKGISVLASGGVGSFVIEEEIEKAKNICVKMDELKSCLLDLKKNLNTINSIRRSVNKKGYNVPEETLPEMKALSR